MLKTRKSKKIAAANAASPIVMQPNAAPIHLELIASAKLDENLPTYNVIETRALDGSIVQFAMPRADAQKKDKILDAVMNLGAAMYPTKAQNISAINRLIGMAPRHSHGNIATRTGWNGVPGVQFVLNNSVIKNKKVQEPSKQSANNAPHLMPCIQFNASAAINVLGEAGFNATSDGYFRKEGSVNDWRDTVAKRAKASSIMRLTVGMALAAPLITLLDADPFIVVLTGPSSKGKTTAEIVAGSVIGRPTKKDLYNWKLSDARLEEVARLHNDTVLIIDDFATGEGSYAARFDIMRNVTHWVTAGGRRGRHSGAMKAINGRGDSHLANTTLILSSYEHPIAKLAELARKTFDGGDLVRMLDVPAESDGAEGVFDGLPAELEQPTEYAANLVEDLKAAARKAHGEVYVAWLKILCGDPSAAKFAVNSAIAEFLEAAKFDRAESIQGRHAKNFAIIYGAGILAIKHKLLPWSVTKFGDAIHKCHQASNRALINALGKKPDVLATLRAALAQRQRFPDWPRNGLPFESAGLDGWQKNSGAAKKVLVIGTRFRAWFHSDAQRNDVLGRLMECNALKARETSCIRASVNGRKSKVRCYELDVGMIPAA